MPFSDCERGYFGGVIAQFGEFVGDLAFLNNPRSEVFVGFVLFKQQMLKNMGEWSMTAIMKQGGDSAHVNFFFGNYLGNMWVIKHVARKVHDS